MDPQAIADYFDEEACCAVAAASDEVRGVSLDLLDALERVGLRGRSVLEVGCGTGGVALEMLRRGAQSVDGIDLSPETIAEARRRATAAGLHQRVTFTVGDGASASLPPRDVVVLDKVYCCYFDPVELRARTVAAAGSVYAMTLPASAGIRGVLARLSVALENVWHRLRGRGFRAYVHDVGRIDAAVRAAGFTPVVAGTRLTWVIRVYRR